MPCLLKCLCVDVESAEVFSLARDARGVITKSCPPHFAGGKKTVPCKQLVSM